MVFFLAIVSIVALVATASAFTENNPGETIVNNSAYTIKVDGIEYTGTPISVIAGDTITVRLNFQSTEDATDVRMKASIEGNKVDVDERTVSFDVEDGFEYSKSLTLTIPSELKDDLSDELELYLKVWNGDLKSESEPILLRVQRPSYNAEVKSVSVASTVEAGEKFPVDIVMKNTGYNDLDDLYVTVSIAELGVSKTGYFGDLVANESDDDDDDETDTMSGRIYLEVPYGTEAGEYTLEVTAESDDGEVANIVKTINVNNEFSAGEVIRNGASLLIVNPTNKLKVYRVVFPESETYVTVSAGNSKSVPVEATGSEYAVSVLTMNGEVVDTFTFNASVEDEISMSNPVVVLTVILAIVFLVLLIVLVVLIGKKPEKSEDFGESYY